MGYWQWLWRKIKDKGADFLAGKYLNYWRYWEWILTEPDIEAVCTLLVGLMVFILCGSVWWPGYIIGFAITFFGVTHAVYRSEEE